MAKFRIKATVMTEITKEIEAPSAEEAESIFYDDTYWDIIDDADTRSVYDISTDSIETVSAKYEIRAYDISYDLDNEEEAPELPTELELEIEAEGDEDTIDFDDLVNDAIEDETGWAVKNFRYKIVGKE